MRASVMWIVNDFSTYAMVSEWSTKGYFGCPVCKDDVTHLVGTLKKFAILVIGDGCLGDHEWREKDKECDSKTEPRLRIVWISVCS